MEGKLDIITTWWQIPVMVVVSAAGLIATILAIKVVIKFDINSFIQYRKRQEQLHYKLKVQQTCSHLWVLYPQSPFSMCSKCTILIHTARLQLGNQLGLEDFYIVSEQWGYQINAGEGSSIFH